MECWESQHWRITTECGKRPQPQTEEDVKAPFKKFKMVHSCMNWHTKWEVYEKAD